MDVVVTKIKRDDEKCAKGIRCQLYEAREILNTTIKKKKKIKNTITSINPKMGIATLLSNPDSGMIQAKFGSCPMGSNSCQ